MRKISKAFILFWTAFIGMGALVGGTCMIIAPSGELLQMQAMLPFFEKLPFSEILFQDYLFSGFALLIVNGFSNILAFILILCNKKIGYILGTIFGFTLMLWICIQFYMFAPAVYAIDIFFFIFGLLQMISGFIAFVRFSQFQYTFNEKDYKINKDSDTLVVYFSRMGYTKKLAYEKASALNANILEIKTPEKIKGNLGFWWCGRFAMHAWPMAIEDFNLNLGSYRNIYICSPIWAFRISAPIRAFLIKYHNDLNNVHFSIVHFMNNPLNKAFKEVEDILEKPLVEKESFRSHYGCIKKVS